MSKKMISGLLAMMALSVSMAQGGTISIVDLPAIGTDGAIDISIDKIYTHTFDFGANAPVTINGVAFEQGPTASLSSVYTGTSSWGYGYTIDDTRRPVNIPVHAGPSDAPADGSSNGLFMDFIYHSGGPVGDGTILTLSDLTAGITYSMRWYYGPFGIGEGRVITFEADGESNGIFSDTIELSLDTGGAHYLDYTFTADDTDVTLRFITHNDNQSAHIYGLSNEVIELPSLASGPNPVDGAEDVPRDVVISWQPGIFAPAINGHKVYFGESFDDVNDAIGGIAQDANSYTPPQRLDFGTTYYWRVDEVNAPPDSTVFEGDVWSFTTEPVGYPIAGENITATASSTHLADTGPENTINGSGLDVNDLHSTEATDMWLSGDEPNGAWIEYELDKVYKLHQMWVWNHNGTMESVLGFGLKDVTIEYSTNGTNYTTLGTTHEFARAPGAVDYAHNTVDLSGVTAKYVRLTTNSNWGNILDQYGLSEVRFFSIPVFAREPSPDSGTTDVAVDVTLGFRAGREADKHDVYLSTDEQAVIDGNAPVTTVTETSSGPLSLDLGKTYYWKINEANDAETPTTWQGDLWSFTTADFFAVDDFEDYNDYPPDEIWATWIDGYGVQTNGATVGYPTPNWNQGEHYVETTTIHGGDQSMPFFYDNTGTATYSEAERTFAVPQDWTKAGVQTLVLYFQGSPGNTGQLYVEVNGSKVPYPGDAADIVRPRWKQWNIDIASLGLNLQSVTTMAIGIDGSGATGILYVDDIRLYRLAPEIVVPSDEIWIEAEAADTIGASWRIYDDPASSGGRHIGSDVGDGDDNDTVPGAEWVAAYNFDAVGGVYKILLRVQEFGSDSFWVRIPGATSQTHEDPDQPGTGWVRFNEIDAPDKWAWDEVHSNDSDPENEVVNWTLPAGANTLEIAKREEGVLLDIIVISKID
ncbi:MAG: discoidin domain-containing protein [Planctomycetes bacterium]|nr:discoidin domain-containing protein [Planctomycetota bacterium]